MKAQYEVCYDMLLIVELYFVFNAVIKIRYSYFLSHLNYFLWPLGGAALLLLFNSFINTYQIILLFSNKVPGKYPFSLPNPPAFFVVFNHGPFIFHEVSSVIAKWPFCTVSPREGHLHIHLCIGRHTVSLLVIHTAHPSSFKPCC